jgi:S1-C subfamily serine protease
VDKVVSGTPAEKARIVPGDIVVASGQSVLESASAVRAAVEAAGTHPLVLSIDRQGKTVKVRVTPAVSGGDPPRIGIAFACHRAQPR